MKQLILIITAITLLSSCTAEPILREDEYQVVDTLSESKNGYGQILGYDVIIKLNHDSTFHYGYISEDGRLFRVEIRSIDFKKYK